MTPVVLRAIALLIALAAIVDPRITSERRVKPQISVVAGDAVRDSALASRVARELANRYTVIRAPFARAAGTVIAGNALPIADLASPVFAVLRDDRESGVAIEAVHASRRAPYDGRVPVTALVSTRGARGDRLAVTLHTGNIIVDRVTRDVASDAGSHAVSLAFVPTATGPVPLRVVAELERNRGVAAADLVVSVEPQRWGVLFFDRRPSWMSTFVRRALERDARFVVTSRVVTSRDISSDAGRPPASLGDLAPLALFDAVVVGAPEALTARDVDGLDAFLRQRGGSVVLLFDHRESGPYERLTASGRWATANERNRTPITASGPSSGDSSGLHATELAWPAQMPAGARVLAGSGARPVVWASAVGAGTLVVSGALDAWRYRDTSAAAFDAFWQAIIGDVSEAAAPMVDARIGDAIIAPGAYTTLDVTLRERALARVAQAGAVRATASAFIEMGDRRVSLRLWPEGGPGRFRAVMRAPELPGSYRVVVTGNGARAEQPFVVADTVSRVTPDERDLVAAFAASRGGVAAPVSGMDQVTRALARAVQSPSRRETWYPMRSVWWIVPFVLALGAEWWWRRRRGRA